jgi:hypothetical protein
VIPAGHVTERISAVPPSWPYEIVTMASSLKVERRLASEGNVPRSSVSAKPGMAWRTQGCPSALGLCPSDFLGVPDGRRCALARTDWDSMLTLMCRWTHSVSSAQPFPGAAWLGVRPRHGSRPRHHGRHIAVKFCGCGRAVVRNMRPTRSDDASSA